MAYLRALLGLLVILALLAGCRAAPATSPAPTTTTAPTIAPASATRASIATPMPVATLATVTVATTPATSAPPAAVSATPTTAPRPAPATPAADNFLLLVTNFGGRDISWVDPARGVIARLEVGAAPWGLAVTPDRTLAYVSTAEGIAIVDLAARQRLALVPYGVAVGPPGSGEYRAGGMGLALAPDGSRLYVGLNLPGGNGRLEVLDTAQRRIVGGVAVGIRPFDVVASPDGRTVYSLDHDSFGVTIVDTATLATRAVTVAPAGRDAFAKVHYGAIGPDGRLLLPIMGRYLARLAPSGEFDTLPLTANTHQHGTALLPDGRLLIVGTGPAGGATGPASLTILDLATGRETILPLARQHERIAVAPDGCTAYLTGGYTLTGGGWDGLTIIDLATGTTRELPVPNLPLDIAILR